LRAARTSGLREFLHLLPNGFSDADHDHTVVREGRLQRTVRAHNRQPPARDVEDQTGLRWRAVPDDPAEGDHDLQPAARISADIRAFFVLGASYAMWTTIWYYDITDSSVLLLVLAVVIFLVGLVSEQISTMRSEGPR
jgi:Flp pilus assembly protein TadB